MEDEIPENDFGYEDEIEEIGDDTSSVDDEEEEKEDNDSEYETSFSDEEIDTPETEPFNFPKISKIEFSNLVCKAAKSIEKGKITLSDSDLQKVIGTGSSDSMGYFMVRNRNEIEFPFMLERNGNKVNCKKFLSEYELECRDIGDETPPIFDTYFSNPNVGPLK